MSKAKREARRELRRKWVADLEEADSIMRAVCVSMKRVGIGGAVAELKRIRDAESESREKAQREEHEELIGLLKKAREDVGIIAKQRDELAGQLHKAELEAQRFGASMRCATALPPRLVEEIARALENIKRDCGVLVEGVSVRWLPMHRSERGAYYVPEISAALKE